MIAIEDIDVADTLPAPAPSTSQVAVDALVACERAWFEARLATTRFLDGIGTKAEADAACVRYEAASDAYREAKFAAQRVPHPLESASLDDEDAS